MTDDQRSAILQIVAVLSGIAIFAVELIRSKVNSPATLDKKTTQAYVAGVRDAEKKDPSIVAQPLSTYGRHGNG